MSTVGANEVRQTLPAQLDRVAAGEAVLVSTEAPRARRAPEMWAAAERIDALLSAARREPLPIASMSAARADNLVANAQSSRATR